MAKSVIPRQRRASSFGRIRFIGILRLRCAPLRMTGFLVDEGGMRGFFTAFRMTDSWVGGELLEGLGAVPLAGGVYRDDVVLVDTVASVTGLAHGLGYG